MRARSPYCVTCRNLRRSYQLALAIITMDDGAAFYPKGGAAQEDV